MRYGTTPEAIAANKTAREAAEAAVTLLNESVAGNPERFWQCVADYATRQLPSKEITDSRSGPMSPKEAARFGLTVMPYGEFKGRLVEDVPLDRLDWYASQSNEFQIELKRYLAEPTISRLVQEALETQES